MTSTPATKQLAAAGVDHDVVEFRAREFTAEEVTRELGLPISDVVKTLVVRGDSGVILAMVGADRELSTRKLARALGERSIDLVDQRDIQRLTGYLKGGVSPLAISVRGVTRYPVVIDERVLTRERVSFSGGRRGVQILIAPTDLVRATEARVADIARD